MCFASIRKETRTLLFILHNLLIFNSVSCDDNIWQIKSNIGTLTNYKWLSLYNGFVQIICRDTIITVAPCLWLCNLNLKDLTQRKMDYKTRSARYYIYSVQLNLNTHLSLHSEFAVVKNDYVVVNYAHTLPQLLSSPF